MTLARETEAANDHIAQLTAQVASLKGIAKAQLVTIAEQQAEQQEKIARLKVHIFNLESTIQGLRK